MMVLAPRCTAAVDDEGVPGTVTTPHPPGNLPGRYSWDIGDDAHPIGATPRYSLSHNQTDRGPMDRPWTIPEDRAAPSRSGDTTVPRGPQHVADPGQLAGCPDLE